MFNMEIKSTIIALGGLLLALVGVFYKGKKAGKEKEKNKQRKVNNETKRKMRNANTISSDAELSRVLKNNKF